MGNNIKKSSWSKSELVKFAGILQEVLQEMHPSAFTVGYYDETLPERELKEGLADSIRVINEVLYFNNDRLFKSVTDKKYSFEFANSDSIKSLCTDIASNSTYIKGNHFNNPIFTKTSIFDGNSNIEGESPVLVIANPLNYHNEEFVNSLFDNAKVEVN